MNLEDYAPALLAMFGAGLQWLRARRNFSDWSYIAVALALATGTYTLTHYFTRDWQLEIVMGLFGIGSYLTNLMGGTLAVAAPARAREGKPVMGVTLPITNSKP
jgi:hypothetical protein